MKFFLEPSIADPTYSNNAESIFDWLSRSTIPLAIDMRRFLNENISHLPKYHHTGIIAGLRSRWNETLLELVVARIMQEFGGVIEIENTTYSGKRPDLWVHFDDGSIIIEATTTYANKKVEQIASERAPLLKIIDEFAPKGWWVDVVFLPDIGPNDSKKEFKKAIQSILNIMPPSPNDGKTLSVVHEISCGTIELALYPATTEAHGLGIQPMITYSDDSLDIIRNAIHNKRKKKQLNGVAFPALLALNLRDAYGNFEEFDRVLFGETYDKYDAKRNLIETGFQPNGIFLKNRVKEPPTIAGLLAFRNVSTMIIEGPVLYKHPRFSGDFPSAFKLFEQRWYDSAANEIKVIPGQLGEIINRLNLVKLNE